jgi:hypothetical protein
MSATKNSPAFDAMMEDARHRDDLNYDEYTSEQYFRNRHKARFPVDDEQPDSQRTNDQKASYGKP